MWTHLKTKHPTIYNRLQVSKNYDVVTSEKLITSPFEKYGLQILGNIDIDILDIVSLICIDVMSINSLANSQTIQKFFLHRHKKSIPKSHKTIRDLIIKTSNTYKNKLTQTIKNLITERKIFSLYLDE